MIISVLLIAAVFVLTAAIYSGGADKKTHEIADIASVDKICELATLKCYYHDMKNRLRDFSNTGRSSTAIKKSG